MQLVTKKQDLCVVLKAEGENKNVAELRSTAT